MKKQFAARRIFLTATYLLTEAKETIKTIEAKEAFEFVEIVKVVELE
jgi:hypothetical protein